MGQPRVAWIGVFLAVLGAIGCERPSNEIDYRGERIKLTKTYGSYDDYKNHPENIDPSETERVQRLVLGAPIARTFGSLVEASKAIGQIAFPGYGSGGFVAAGLLRRVIRSGNRLVFISIDGKETLVRPYVAR